MSARSRKRRQDARLRAKDRDAKKKAKVKARAASASPSSAKASSDRRRSTKAFTIDANRFWYAARMVTGMRTKACEALKEIGVTTFTARASETVLRRERRVIRRTPLIPGIVFVGLPKDIALIEVTNKDGVADILRRPRELDDSGGNLTSLVGHPARFDVAALQRFVDALELGEIERPAGIKEGDNVILRTGPFASFPGIVEKILPNERLKVGVAVFGKATPVEVGIAEVQVV